MNTFDLKTWSARQQVLAVFLLAGGLIFLFCYFVLYPQNRERRNLETKIAGMSDLLAREGLLLDEDILQKKLTEEQNAHKSLLEEWNATALRLAAFPNQKELATSQVLKVDFKEALFNVRQRLKEASKALGIRLPYDLGIEEAVHSSEDSRKLMLQLRAVEKLADLALNLKTGSFRDIRPMLPILHTVGDGTEGYLEEYPVLVEFYGTLDNLYDLFSAVLEKEHVFFLKNLRIESAASTEKQDLLKIKAVLSAPVFLKDPSELKPVPRKAVWWSGPKGA